MQPSRTVPVVAGRKYVRRDGKVVEISRILDSVWAVDVNGCHYWASTGFRLEPGQGINSLDLISDYIEPAKGHPHAALMLEFARDAQESETPWDRWECKWGDGVHWNEMKQPPVWSAEYEYRRKSTTTPDPHAATAAEYAKDMAETDKAWERWQSKIPQLRDWMDCIDHPVWSPTHQYRRKESL